MEKYKANVVIGPDIFNEDHYRIYVTATDYWVVCGETPEDALRRFESFSNYKVENVMYTRCDW